MSWRVGDIINLEEINTATYNVSTYCDDEQDDHINYTMNSYQYFHEDAIILRVYYLPIMPREVGYDVYVISGCEVVNAVRMPKFWNHKGRLTKEQMLTHDCAAVRKAGLNVEV